MISILRRAVNISKVNKAEDTLPPVLHQSELLQKSPYIVVSNRVKRVS